MMPPLNKISSLQQTSQLQRAPYQTRAIRISNTLDCFVRFGQSDEARWEADIRRFLRKQFGISMPSGEEIERYKLALTDLPFSGLDLPTTARIRTNLAHVGIEVFRLETTHQLLKRYPKLSEGKLTPKRDFLTNISTLSKTAKMINLVPLIQETTSEAINDRKIAIAFRAFLAVLWQEGHNNEVTKLVRSIIIRNDPKGLKKIFSKGFLYELCGGFRAGK